MIGKTYSAKPSEIKRNWFIIDAKDLVLGRLSVIVANILRGKGKSIFTPHMDCGDHVIITNAEKIFLTGKKLKNKIHYWHTGYPGGLKQRTAGQILEGKFPERLLRLSIERMITRNPLGRKVLKKLYIYKDNEHPHTAQQPKKLDVAGANRKNSKSS
jgi:large subunit ribosomal protein L13